SNSFDDPNFICTPKRLFTFFAITRTLDLIGNAFGFLITTATFTSQTNLSFEALCGREFCFSTHRDDLISSLSSIANFFMIFTRKFIPISTQKTSFSDLFPLGIASGYLDIFIFYEISNAIIYCVTSNVADVCTILTCVLLFLILFIIFVIAI
uniref:Uncharacterized protein n=1 Tax=Parascaris univalens TaxID=6257 RepID=A0A915AXB5_PARUN